MGLTGKILSFKLSSYIQYICEHMNVWTYKQFESIFIKFKRPVERNVAVNVN